MRHMIPGVAAMLLTPALLNAQVRPPDARAVPTDARVESAALGHACELTASDGIILHFGICPPSGRAGMAKEVEIVEYRNGDAPMRVARVMVGGVVREDLAVVHLGLSDPDDDGDGVPAQVAQRRAGGRMKVGRVTLSRNVRGTDPGIGDADGDGFPVAVDLQDRAGGSTTVTFEGCVVTSGTAPAAGTVVLVCREVRMAAAPDASPHARFIAGTTGRSAVSLVERRAAGPADSAAPVARGASRSPRTLRLEGARLENWSVDFDPGREGTGRWTFALRATRVEG